MLADMAVSGAEPMTDLELLRWLAEHGTNISEEELATHFPRVLAEEDVEDESPAR